jgi:hypothetical protein
VERGHQRDSQSPYEVQNVGAVFAAPDARLELNRDDVHAAVIEGMGHVGIVALDVAPDAVTDFGRIGAGLARRVKGDDLALTDRCGQIVGERRYPTSAWRIGRNEGCPRDEVLLSRGTANVAGRSAARDDCRPGRECRKAD